MGRLQDATRPGLVSAGGNKPFYTFLAIPCPPLRERTILTKYQTLKKPPPASKDTQTLKRAQPLRRSGGGCRPSEEGSSGPEEGPQDQKKRDSERAGYVSRQVNRETGVLRGAKS